MRYNPLIIFSTTAACCLFGGASYLTWYGQPFVMFIALSAPIGAIWGWVTACTRSVTSQTARYFAALIVSMLLLGISFPLLLPHQPVALLKWLVLCLVLAVSYFIVAQVIFAHRGMGNPEQSGEYTGHPSSTQPPTGDEQFMMICPHEAAGKRLRRTTGILLNRDEP